MKRARYALCAAVVAAYAGQAAAQTQIRLEGKQPFEIIRSFQALQDQIVLGNAAVKENLPKAMEQISARLLASDREVWREAKNAQAAVIFSLSGGKSKLLRRGLEIALSPESDLELMRGALAFMEGRDAEAKKILLPIDARALASTVRGHIAIVQSTLVAKDDPKAAIGFLDQARILAPGTLVEETALRRELILADELADFDKFASLSRQYLWRFPRSVYFDNFRQRFASSIIRFCLTGETASFWKIENLLSELDSLEQLRLYLQIAHTSVLNGKVGSTVFASGKAVQLSKAGSIENARAKLYQSAALILTNQIEAGQSELERIDPALLPKPDLQLKEAIVSLGSLIRNDPEVVAAASASESNDRSSLARDEAGEGGSLSALMDLAHRKLGETDELLKGKRN
ncbi:hypothetical protein CU048_04640 [Beijerinckiaceae bacterium]|nr:hypothetical protein CU048_04640 [Beijerinckiaceae bacterium]